jgi:hypothetical protein
MKFIILARLHDRLRAYQTNGGELPSDKSPRADFRERSIIFQLMSSGKSNNCSGDTLDCLRL